MAPINEKNICLSYFGLLPSVKAQHPIEGFSTPPPGPGGAGHYFSVSGTLKHINNQHNNTNELWQPGIQICDWGWRSNLVIMAAILKYHIVSVILSVLILNVNWNIQYYINVQIT